MNYGFIEQFRGFFVKNDTCLPLGTSRCNGNVSHWQSSPKRHVSLRIDDKRCPFEMPPITNKEECAIGSRETLIYPSSIGTSSTA